MENTPRRSRSRLLYLPVLAVGVALVAAVSSWAASPAASTTPAQSSPQAAQQIAPIQDTQTTPAEPDGNQAAARKNCPEKDGAGNAGTATPQPDTSTSTQSETQL